MTTRSTSRRTDPGRRDRIIDACLDVVAEFGVAGTSHRRVAAAAGVPLGSMTYHFSGMDDLLRAAFARFAGDVGGRVERSMAAAPDADAAERALVDVITQGTLADQRELVLTLELYTLAARESAYRELTDAWMARSRAALERHFAPAVAAQLHALVEGLSIHRALVAPGASEILDAGAVADAVRRVVGRGA